MILGREMLEHAHADIEAITRQAFEILAALVPEKVALGSDYAEQAFVAVVDVNGSGAGSVVVEISPPLAYEFTSRLMGVESPSSLDENVIDALGELVNTIGGNYKGLLDPDLALSTPRVFCRNEWKEERAISRIPAVISCDFTSGRCVAKVLEWSSEHE